MATRSPRTLAQRRGSEDERGPEMSLVRLPLLLAACGSAYPRGWFWSSRGALEARAMGAVR